MPIKDVDKLEAQNENIAINVFWWNDWVIVYRISEQAKCVYKKSIVRRTKKYAGLQNGGIQLYLVASLVLAPEWAYSLTTIFYILKTISDSKDRLITVDIKTESKTLTLVNIYASNNNDPSVFENVFKHLLTFECEEVIFGVHFNLVLDVQKEKKRREPRNTWKILAKS